MKNRPLRLSPSQINSFNNDPAVWVLKHYYGLTSGANIFCVRGHIIEAGLDQLAKGESFTKAQIESENMFYDKTMYLEDDAGILEFEPQLPGYLCKADEAYFEALNDCGGSKTVIMQQRIDTAVEGVDIIGFLDYYFPEIGTIFDLKTVNRLPKILTRGQFKGSLEAYRRKDIVQQSLYSMVTGAKNCYLLYVTDEDHLVYKLSKEDLEYGQQVVTDTVKKIKDLVSKDLEEVLEITKPTVGKVKSFFYNDEMREKACEIWGLTL
jgi:hypothetical protein